MANDFLSFLKDATGLSGPVLEKFKEHDIDRDLFIIMTVSFMKEVLRLTPYDIMKIKTLQAKLKVDQMSSPEHSRTGSGSDDFEDSSPNSGNVFSACRKRRKEDDATHSSSDQSQVSPPSQDREQQMVPFSKNSKPNSPLQELTPTSGQKSQKGPSSSKDQKYPKAPQSSQNTHFQSKPNSSQSGKAGSSSTNRAESSQGFQSKKNSSQSRKAESSTTNREGSSQDFQSNKNSSQSQKAGSSTANQEESNQGNEHNNSISDSESDKENSDSGLITENDLDNAVKEFKAEPEPSFASLKPSLPKFDVISILHKEMMKAHSRFKASFVELLQKKHLDRTKRLCIIRKLTGYLYMQHASSPQEVTPSMKEGMAKSFCILFPKFANLDDKDQPWSTVFSPRGPAGFIANASRAFMREHPKRSGKQTKKRKATESTCPEMDDADIEALGIMDSGRNEKPEILDGMAKCFQVREAERARGESITFFMKKYPQFNKYGGEVLNEEFKRLRPQAEDMCKLFLKLLPKILTLNFRREANLPMKDDGMKAMVILSQHLPHDIPRRNEKVAQSWAELKDILVVLKPSDSVEGYVVKRIEKAKTPIQPYLIFIRGQVDKDRIMKIFIVLDSELCAVDTVSSIKAIDWLFKCYFIFNVDYPFGWRNTFHLL